MANFNNAIDITLGWEGGAAITDDPDDPGGLTRYGISQRAHPDEDIRALTEERAREIYRADYWNAVRGNDILNDGVARMVFDMAVNTGVKQASLELQRAVNHVTGSKVLVEDGIIGRRTIAQVDRVDAGRVGNQLLGRRLEYYARLVQRRSEMAKFLVGWIRRSLDVAGMGS